MKVFVSGCFDMLHSGHVAFLEEASSYGDLYVGLGSDATIGDLKGRRTVNSEAERLYMVKALRCVKDAWVNRGSGVMDFEAEVRELRPDIFFVNTDGYTPLKEHFCDELGIRLVVSRRVPHGGLPVRSTTALRQECTIPYRVELGGGWLDQPFVNQVCPGSVIVMSIEPDLEFNQRSGMATSSRAAAIGLWRTGIPEGNREHLARTLFCCDNPPGTERISGSQDSLGILLPGLNRLDYASGYWPRHIESCLDEKVLRYVEEHAYLIALPPRREACDVLAGCKVTESGARRLAESAAGIWSGILNFDSDAWGHWSTACLEAQLSMFPGMWSPELGECVDRYRGVAKGWKLTGAGCGGYLVLVSEEPLEHAVKIHACRR